MQHSYIALNQHYYIFLVRSILAKHCRECSKYKFNILHNAHIFNILKIQFPPSVPFDLGSATNLPVAGETWLNDEALLLVGIALFHLMVKDWSWTDDTHVAFDDVKKLWELVD